MIKKLKELLSHPLISGSTIVLFGSFLVNLLNYAFNFLMWRLLHISDFGLLQTLMSLFALFGILATAFSGIFARFTAKYYSSNDAKRFSALFTGGLKLLTCITLTLFVTLLCITPIISSFLHIRDSRLLILIYFLIVISIYSSLIIGILQGQLRFYFLSFFNLLSALIKIVLGVLFIFIGWKLLGLLFAVVIASMIPLIGTFIYLRVKNKVYKDVKEEKIFLRSFQSYGTKFFLSSIGITLFTTLDILLVRHFFPPVITGEYAALSLMGKAIFYLTSPIYFVFFPLIVQKREKKESLVGTLSIAVVIIGVISISLSLIYFLFPTVIINIFFPGQIILAQYLGFYSLYIVVFSIASLFSNFFLSIGKTNIYKINIGCGILFVILISLFHSTLFAVITILFIVALVLLSLLLLYFRYYERD